MKLVLGCEGTDMERRLYGGNANTDKWMFYFFVSTQHNVDATQMDQWTSAFRGQGLVKWVTCVDEVSLHPVLHQIPHRMNPLPQH